ncbi:hypothetical protein Tco_0232248 [Tanacetum coccineum]
MHLHRRCHPSSGSHSRPPLVFIITSSPSSRYSRTHHHLDTTAATTRLNKGASGLGSQPQGCVRVGFSAAKAAFGWYKAARGAAFGWYKAARGAAFGWYMAARGGCVWLVYGSKGGLRLVAEITKPGWLFYGSSYRLRLVSLAAIRVFVWLLNSLQGVRLVLAATAFRACLFVSSTSKSRHHI